ncbi:MAG: sugar ABC transporter permease [Chloroflexi bacterium]|nr:MAG: sugar ABC transporter permease [Chloroflexota bacterium]
MWARTEEILPYALLLPSLVFLALLILIPMVQALVLAIQADSGEFTTAYLQRMAVDVNFNDAWRNTLLLIVLALAMALLVNSRFKGHQWFLYVYAIPLAISDLAAGILWLAVFTERGYLNTAAQGLGIVDQAKVYLSFENFGGLVAAIVIAESWRATAIVMVILVAGLQLIPRDFFEAADLFGANRLRRTLYVVLPLLRPSLQSALIIRTIFAFQTFAVVLALAGRNMPVIAAEAYSWYANNRDAHLAASYALLLLGLTIVFTFVYLRVLGLREAEVKR